VGHVRGGVPEHPLNALNVSTVLSRVTRQDASNANYVQTILAP